MSFKKNTQVEEFDYSNTSDEDIRKNIALLTVLAERAKSALDAVKAEAVRREIGMTDSEEVAFNGQCAGTIGWSKATEGSLYVADPIAYAEHLAHSGYESMVEEVLYPKPEAFAKSFLEARRKEDLFDEKTGLIVKESGVLPDGVKQRSGKSESVIFRKNKNVTDHLFELLKPEDVVKQITSGETGEADE